MNLSTREQTSISSSRSGDAPITQVIETLDREMTEALSVGSFFNPEMFGASLKPGDNPILRWRAALADLRALLQQQKDEATKWERRCADLAPCNPDWDLLEATQESQREYIAEVIRLRALLQQQETKADTRVEPASPASSALVPQSESGAQSSLQGGQRWPREKLFQQWKIAALLKDRTRREIRERARAGGKPKHLEIAEDFGVPIAFVDIVASWQMFEDESCSPDGDGRNGWQRSGPRNDEGAVDGGPDRSGEDDKLLDGDVVAGRNYQQRGSRTEEATIESSQRAGSEPADSHSPQSRNGVQSSLLSGLNEQLKAFAEAVDRAPQSVQTIMWKYGYKFERFPRLSQARILC